MVLFIIIVYIAEGIFWGAITQRIIENKGYYDNWFWWGFFFRIPALAVALSKPEQRSNTYYGEMLLEKRRTDDILGNEGWECIFCHSLNENIVSTCACGRSREESQEYFKIQNKAAAEQDVISLLKEYKDLMDNGIITESEFNTKKKELLKREVP